MKMIFGVSLSLVVAMGAEAEIRKPFTEAVQGTNGVAWLAAAGITNPADVAALQGGLDESATLDIILRAGSASAYSEAFSKEFDNMSSVDQAKVRERVASAPRDPDFHVWLTALPEGERMFYKTDLVKSEAASFRQHPTYAALYCDYVFLTSPLGGTYSRSIPVHRQIEAVLAPELVSPSIIRLLKEAIAARLVPAAIAKLGKERKSYVSKNGKSLLDGMIAPALAALNAPLCKDLEAELEKLGIKVDSVADRAPLKAWSDERVDELWMGKTLSDDALARVAVALGVDGFNDLKARYNGEK